MARPHSADWRHHQHKAYQAASRRSATAGRFYPTGHRIRFADPAKLGSYSRQNSLALALREIGRMGRTLYMLTWLEGPTLRRHVTAGLNKREARNSLARAVFFSRLGEVQDRSFEDQRHRASGLNLVTAAITLRNTVYLERAVEALGKTQAIDPALLQHVSTKLGTHQPDRRLCLDHE